MTTRQDDKPRTATPGPRSAAERTRQRTAAMRARADGIAARAQAERGRHGALDAAFEIVDRDFEVGGGIIAGALAYRLFIWLLPFGLVVVGGLGLAADASSSPKDLAGSVGLGGLVASSFQSSSQTSHWYALLVGTPILLLATRSLLRALIGAHRLAWGDVRAAAPKPTLTASSELLGLLFAYFALAACSSWARKTGPGLGLGVTLATALGFAAGWLLMSQHLPRREAQWLDLVPGAVVVGLGLGVLQAIAAYVLGPYALAKEGTYGMLGIAAALLFGLFVMSRLVVGAAEINATLWDRKSRRS